PPPALPLPQPPPPSLPKLHDGYCAVCQRHHFSSSCVARGRLQPVEHCPKTLKPVVPIHLIGHAGTGVGSSIRGHCRRGGNKFRKYHARTALALVVDEFKTTKVCSYCFARTRLARQRRVMKDSQIKMVACNGAIECVNINCQSRRLGHTIRNRDGNASQSIGVSGVSALLSGDNQPIPPYRRFRPAPSTPTKETCNVQDVKTPTLAIEANALRDRP
ncbi:hypothetical protein BGZ72_005184, partial [Mortierella alpina]